MRVLVRDDFLWPNASGVQVPGGVHRVTKGESAQTFLTSFPLFQISSLDCFTVANDGDGLMTHP
jgi:hypothetical protein